MPLKSTFVLTAFFLSINVQAGYLCEIDHVENSNGGIKVAFNKDANINIRGVKRLGSQKADDFKANSALILKEGDESGIYLGPHDFCVAKAEKREGKLGILVTSNNHIPGVAATDRSEFIIPVK